MQTTVRERDREDVEAAIQLARESRRRKEAETLAWWTRELRRGAVLREEWREGQRIEWRIVGPSGRVQVRHPYREPWLDQGEDAEGWRYAWALGASCDNAEGLAVHLYHRQWFGLPQVVYVDGWPDGPVQVTR